MTRPTTPRFSKVNGEWSGKKVASAIKIFERAAFYGGTALRILYGLDRGSEDMDFSLLEPNEDFHLQHYGIGIKRELESFGFAVDFAVKEKTKLSPIESAFLKGNTKTQLITVGLPASLTDRVHSHSQIKIKFEVDLDPPSGFRTEVKTLLRPVPHTVRTYALSDLFAGKLHAVLCRRWKTRTKGRDWYDLVWYVANRTPVHLAHLEQRLHQSGDFNESSLTLDEVQCRLRRLARQLDIDEVKRDVLSFVRDPECLALWSREFFLDVIDGLRAQ